MADVAQQRSRIRIGLLKEFSRDWNVAEGLGEIKRWVRISKLSQVFASPFQS